MIFVLHIYFQSVLKLEPLLIPLKSAGIPARKDYVNSFLHARYNYNSGNNTRGKQRISLKDKRKVFEI